MADEEVELSEEQQQEIALQKELAEKLPALTTVDDFTASVINDEEHLVVLAVVHSQCPFSRGLRSTLIDIATPRAVTKHAKFLRVDVASAAGSGELAQHLGITQVPAVILYLKGTERARSVGDGAEKLRGVFRNQLIKRNEEMREYDLAKIARENPPPEEEGEGEEAEGEEGEEEEG